MKMYNSLEGLATEFTGASGLCLICMPCIPRADVTATTVCNTFQANNLKIACTR